MRKKSHLSLAKYLVESLNTEELNEHRKAFYWGNILPDCKPSFVTRKHEFVGTYGFIKEDIRKLTIDCDLFARNERVYWRNLGQVIHYMADYFTFPHNVTYEGNLKEHCAYEQELKLSLRAYLKSGKAIKDHSVVRKMNSVENLFSYIERTHAEYIQKKRTIEEDIQYIVAICTQVIYSMIHLLNMELEKVLQPMVA